LLFLSRQFYHLENILQKAFNISLHHSVFTVAFFTMLLSAFFVLSSPYSACAQNSSTQKSVESKKAQINKLQQDIEFLDRQIAQTQKKRKNTLEELALIKKKVETRKLLIAQLDKEIARQSDEIYGKTIELGVTQRHMDTLKMYYKRMIIKAYRNRDSRTWFMYILASNSIEQGYRRWSYLKDYSRALNDQAKNLKEVQNKIADERKNITHLQTENIKTQKSKTEEYNKFKTEEQKSNAYANSLARQQKKFSGQLQQKKRQAAQLNREVQRMIAAAIAAERKKAANSASSSRSTSTKKSTSSSSEKAAPMTYSETPESAQLSGEFRNNRGRLPWPVRRGVITEGYGEHNDNTVKGGGLPFNNGINISAPRGCSIQSVFEGTVKQIIVIPGYSHCVLIQHGNYFTFYCKLGSVSVRVGQKVSTGQTIGTLDSSMEESVLHFELWAGTQKQNPESWLKRY
jgi:septal ring factor EnvC (AmiA/AmiB activator)